MVVPPGAAANHLLLLSLGGKHVVVHRDDHGDEYNRIVEKMQFYAREYQLQDTARHRLAPEVVMSRGLPDQQEMLDVMPELDYQGHGPPGPRSPGKSFAQHPEENQHHQGVAIVQGLGLDQPGVPQTQQAIGFRAWPSH